MRIVWTAAGLRDLAAIREFIAFDNPAAADRQVQRILTSVDSLSRFPHLGRPGRRPGTRELAVGGPSYLIAYRVRQGELEITRILHGRQRWPGAAVNADVTMFSNFRAAAAIPSR